MTASRKAHNQARKRNRAATAPLNKLCACARPAVVMMGGSPVCGFCRDIESRFRQP